MEESCRTSGESIVAYATILSPQHAPGDKRRDHMFGKRRRHPPTVAAEVPILPPTGSMRHLNQLRVLRRVSRFGLHEAEAPRRLHALAVDRAVLLGAPGEDEVVLLADKHVHRS